VVEPPHRDLPLGGGAAEHEQSDDLVKLVGGVLHPSRGHDRRSIAPHAPINGSVNHGRSHARKRGLPWQHRMQLAAVKLTAMSC
jgi:hypothetical protein